MCKQVHILIIITLSSIFSTFANVREKRWLRNTYTDTKTVTEMVTLLVPSSCVQIDPTIPACRGVRSLQNFPNLFTQKPKSIDYTFVKEEQELISSTRYIGWGEYFGFIAPTVTQIVRQRETTSVMDPRMVVTYSIKGCKPTILPLDLDLCPEEEISATATVQNAFPVEHTLPSHGFEPEQSITDYIKGNSQFGYNDVKSQGSIDSLQASYPSDVEDEVVTQPTDRLQSVKTQIE